MTGRQRRSQTATLVVLIILLMLLIWLLWRVFMAVPPAPRPKVTTGALSVALRGAPARQRLGDGGEATPSSCAPGLAPAHSILDQLLALRDALAINH
jgi:hypothetical protein